MNYEGNFCDIKVTTFTRRDSHTTLGECGGVQLLSHVRLFVTHGLQRARLPCPSLSLRVCSNSCPLSR